MSRFLSAILGLVLAAAVVGCGESKDERGLNYMPDMYDSPAKKSQEAWRTPAVVDEDGKVVQQPVDVPMMLEPVAGSVPRDFNAYDIPNTPEGLESAMALENPIAPTVPVLIRGQDRYDIFCAVCHGKDGQVANSYVAGEGRVQGIVSITTPTVAAMPDGQVFHIITHGRGRMPNYRAQLLPEDRWSVIHYLRALNDAVSGDEEALRTFERLEREGAKGLFRPLPEPIPEYERSTWPGKIRREENQ